MATALSNVKTKPEAIERAREDFPILSTRVHGKRLVYLDSAATTQKPRCVIEALENYYTHYNANIHRGVHALSQRATDAYEKARHTVARFLGAADARECIFVRGATEAINLVAHSYGRAMVRAGDEVLISWMEHHSNIVPWQMLCEQVGAHLRVVPITDTGELDMAAFRQLLSPRTRLVALVHVSNALGTINPVREVIRLAHEAGARVLLDGAQAVSHLPVDVRELDCDFYAFSGHKLYGPTGIGVLYGKAELLDAMPPFMGGGDMIASVTFEKTTYNTLPAKFEAGTPHISGAIGLAAAIEYVERLGMEAIALHEEDLLRYGTERLSTVPGIRLVGTASHKAAILSFTMDRAHPHDIGTVLDLEGVAIRTGHHCCQPIMQRYGVPATARASLGVYNNRQDIDALVEALQRVREVFAE
jgi:cysteine desulfurase/selenocysteine lyase